MSLIVSILLVMARSASDRWRAKTTSPAGGHGNVVTAHGVGIFRGFGYEANKERQRVDDHFWPPSDTPGLPPLSLGRRCDSGASRTQLAFGLALLRTRSRMLVSYAQRFVEQPVDISSERRRKTFEIESGFRGGSQSRGIVCFDERFIPAGLGFEGRRLAHKSHDTTRVLRNRISPRFGTPLRLIHLLEEMQKHDCECGLETSSFCPAHRFKFVREICYVEAVPSAFAERACLRLAPFSVILPGGYADRTKFRNRHE